jgi:hypothetical protein
MTEERQRKIIRRELRKRSFCVLATASAANRPLAVGVLYAAVDRTLYIATLGGSVKARNVRENPRVALSIPVRRVPFAPPFSIQFQGTAELRAPDDPELARLLAAGALERITSHGELDPPDACFIRVTPGPRVATYGLGVSLRAIIRDPIGASRSVRMP